MPCFSQVREPFLIHLPCDCSEIGEELLKLWPSATLLHNAGRESMTSSYDDVAIVLVTLQLMHAIASALQPHATPLNQICPKRSTSENEPEIVGSILEAVESDKRHEVLIGGGVAIVYEKAEAVAAEKDWESLSADDAARVVERWKAEGCVDVDLVFGDERILVDQVAQLRRQTIEIGF